MIQYLVRELSLPIRIVPAPIQRAEDGLALSSRNRYLSPEERARAPLLHQGLLDVAAAMRAGTEPAEAARQAESRLARAGFVVDYLQVRRARDLRPPQAGERGGLVILVAARLGLTRLIDHLEVGPEEI